MAPAKPMTSLIERLGLGRCATFRFRQKGMYMRRTVILTAACLLLLFGALWSPAVAGGRAGYGCPPAFDLGGLTLPETLTLPRIQAGLAAGAYTEADHTAIFNSVDHNDNGVVCFKDVAALNGGAADASGWQYLYNLVDDNASVPER
jgi:hypothetical protein